MKYSSAGICLALFLALFCQSCQKAASPPANPSSGPTHDTITTLIPGRPDSIYVLSGLGSFDGEAIGFGYDGTHHRYTSIFGVGVYTYDSSLFYYNTDGSLAYVVEKNNSSVTSGYGITEYVTVLTYDQQKQIAKIYTKRKAVDGLLGFAKASSTDISDSSSPIGFADSLVYDAKHRIAAAYRIFYQENSYWITGASQGFYYTPLRVGSYRLFTYQPSNDSLLAKVEEYSVDSNKIATLANTYVYQSYDSAVNPFYQVCPIYGLFANITKYFSQPHSGFNGYSHDMYLSFSPHNCTNSSEDGNVAYLYNGAGLPVKSYFPAISPQMDYTTIRYARVLK